MFNVHTFLRQAVLALALAGSSLAAMAGPVAFHVKIDTSALSGAGKIDLMFQGESASPLTATLRNFTGAYGPVTMEEKVTFNADGSIGLVNMPDFGSLLAFDVTLGDIFGFDVLFSDDQSGDTIETGSFFSVGLHAADSALGSDLRGIAWVELKPGEGVIDASGDGEFGGVDPIAAAVPEPSDWLLMATGLALLGASLRRRMPR